MKKEYLKEYIQDIGDKIEANIKPELIKNIIRNRHNSLKNIIYKFQRLIVRLINS